MEGVADTLRELGNIGSGNAAASLEDWLGEPINISMTDALLLPAEDVLHRLDGTGSPFLGIHAQVTGGLEGHIVYLLGIEEVKRILSILMGGAEEEGLLTDCQTSALSETGNILFSSYVNALYEILDVEINITPPRCSHDPGVLLGGAGSGCCSGRPCVMLVETLLINEAALLSGRLLFFTWEEAVAGILEKAERR